MDFDAVVAFHGHRCPGLAIGYRLTLAALAALEEGRAADDELVAITENDACGVDALQYLAGCTFGKGNLQFLDYGKQAYTLFSRRSRRGVRVVFHRDRLPPELEGDRPALTGHILQAPAADIITVTPVAMVEPERARARCSVRCPICGEMVMETRLKERGGRQVCVPCAERA